MNRSLLTAIAIPVVVLVTAGAYVLISKPGHHSPGSALPAASAGPSGSGDPASRSPDPKKSKDPRKPKHKNAATPLDHGFVGVAVNGNIAASVKSFSRTTGVHPALVEIYTLFGAPFPWNQASRAWATRATPFIQWNPRHAPMAAVAAGQYDRYIRHFASAVKSFGHPIVLSFAHEMNGTWYPWGRPNTSPAQFIAAWRRVHTVFAEKHVTNVTWSWDPSHGGSPASEWWPGSRYVDWVGVDGYLRPGQTFKLIFHRQFSIIRHITSKPMFIAETAVAPSPGQASQITSLFKGVKKYKLLGFVWFDVNRLKAWQLEGRPPAVRAFRRSVTHMG